MPIKEVLLIASLVGGLAACASTGDDMPAETDDGLSRVSGARVDAAYVAPGADFGEYEVLYIREVKVSFTANWLRDINRDRRSLSTRVSQEDADRIKVALAESFEAVFTKQLQKAGYRVLEDKASAGAEDDILVLEPALIDLDVTAPDIMTSSRTRTYATSAGSMILQIEMYDGLSSALLARVIDDREALDHGTVRVSNSVTNQAEAERIFRRWADLLVKALNEAHGR